MALGAATQWAIRYSATANNVNGGGFNTGNANFLTDLAGTSATGNTPSVSSATYTFVAGDVGHWVYVSSGTNWTAGFYQIASVAAGAATLSAAIGEAVQYNTTQGRWMPNTVAGCATVASPTGGTFGVDYSQGTTAIATNTDLTCTSPSTTVTSASAPFTRVMVGNIIHLTALTGAGAVVGWYEIVNFTNTSNVVLDRTPTGGANITAGTFYIGGAMSLNSTLDDDWSDAVVAGNIVWIKYNAAAISLGENVSPANSGTSVAPVIVEGFGTIRGDRPIGTSRPTVDIGTRTLSFSSYWHSYNFILTGTAATMFTTGTSSIVHRCKVVNTSTTASRVALSPSLPSTVMLSMLVSLRGTAISSGNTTSKFLYNIITASNIGILTTSTTANPSIVGNIIESCVTAAIQSTAASSGLVIAENTLFGSTNTTGKGIDFSTTGAGANVVINNIIAGFATGISHTDTTVSSFSDYNDFYNNDADVSAAGQWQKGPNSAAVDPSFTSVGQVTGTAGAFAAGNDRLIDTSKNFTSLGVVANQDYVYIVSGTGATTMNYAITSITTTTNPNDTLILSPAPGTNTTTDKVYQITTGHNFLPTGSI